MSAKDLVFDTEARAALKKGVDKENLYAEFMRNATDGGGKDAPAAAR